MVELVGSVFRKKNERPVKKTSDGYIAFTVMKNERKKLTQKFSSLLLNYILHSFTTKAAAELFLNLFGVFSPC